MNIWIMNHYATTMYRDKAGRHYWFAKQLEKLGHKVTIFCACTFLDNQDVIDTKDKKWTVNYDGETPFVFIKTNTSVGNGIDRVRNMGNFYLNLIPSALQYCKQYGNPDVIIASSVHPLTMVAGIKIARRLKVPCICEVRDLWPEAIFRFGKANEKSLLGRILITGEHWIYKNADALIFTKEGDTDYLKEKGWTMEQGGDIDLTKCHYINNGVDLKAFEEKIHTITLDDADLNNDQKFNVTYAGVIRPVNNVGNILDAARLLQKDTKYQDVQFLIYGDGSEFESLNARVQDEHIANVKMKGYIERKFIPYILSRSSINLLNYSQSHYNWSRGNSSNKLFEYMASGKPIISTVQMGYSIIKKYHCGVELQADTPECLAEEIKKIHEMDAGSYQAMGKNAHEGAKDFDFEILTGKLMEVIESVMG